MNRESLFFLMVILIITSCNLTESDNNSNCKIDSTFEKIMNTPCDTISRLSKIEEDNKLSRIQMLEDNIASFNDPDNYEENIDSARQLHKIDPFNENAIEYFLRYYESKKIDSISLFFNNLINKYPKRVEPLLLRSKFLYFKFKNYEDNHYFIEKEKYLKRAFLIDSNNVEVCYNLGELYYKDFLNLSENKSILLRSVDNALKFLNKTIELDSSQLNHLFFPISQLNKFKNNSIKITLNPMLGIENNCYLPSWYFANLQDNWETDYKTNYIFLIDESSWQSDGLKVQLSALAEPCLYNLSIPEKYEVYRFTWLRSFDHPIVVRVVKSCEEYNIYWKIGKGSGGYKPEGIRECGKRELTKKEWNEFKEVFERIKFDELPHSDYQPSCDGAIWTLEKANSNYYKAYNTKEPYKIGKLCMLMIKMTGLKIDEERVY